MIGKIGDLPRIAAAPARIAAIRRDVGGQRGYAGAAIDSCLTMIRWWRIVSGEAR
jgi:hypothetical protein